MKVIGDNKIFASYDQKTIRVYQAYRDEIADAALLNGTFAPPFSLDRMTWIKPSFLWMMYRSGWGAKAGQTRVLAVDMLRTGFDEVVSKAVLSSFSEKLYESYEAWQAQKENSEARCQWDPARDIYGNPLKERTIQLGIKGSLIRKYSADWVVGITDISSTVLEIRKAISSGQYNSNMLPIETEYFVKERQ